MTDKIPYVQMRTIFENLMDQFLFNAESINFHGWNKEEFLGFLEQEFAASADEETYDIAIEAPTTLQ